MPSARHNTAVAYINAFKDLSDSTFRNLRSPTCLHTFAPASTNLPDKDNAAFLPHIAFLKTVIESFRVTPIEITENGTKNQVVVWASGNAQFLDQYKDAGLTEEEWSGHRGEYIFILTMDETGERIERVVEFVDTKETEKVRGLLRRAVANKERLGK